MDDLKGGENLLGRITTVPAEHPNYPGLLVEGMASDGRVYNMKYRDFGLSLDGDRYRATTYYDSCRDLREVVVEDDYPPMRLGELYPMMVRLYAEAARKREEAKAKELREYEVLAYEYFRLAETLVPTTCEAMARIAYDFTMKDLHFVPKQDILVAHLPRGVPLIGTHHEIDAAKVSGDGYCYAVELLVKRAVIQRHAVPANCHDLPWGRVPVWLDEQVGTRIDGFLRRGSWKYTDRIDLLRDTLWPEERPPQDRPDYRRSHWSDFNAVKGWSRSIWARLTGRAADIWRSPLVTTANLIAEKTLHAKNLPLDRENGQRPLLLHVRRVAGLLSEQPWATEEIVAAALLRDVLDAGPAFSRAALRAEVGDAVVDRVGELRGPQGHEGQRLEKDRLAATSPDAKRILIAGWIDLLRDDGLDEVRWGRLAGEVRSVADVVVGADEGLHHRLMRAWAGRR